MTYSDYWISVRVGEERGDTSEEVTTSEGIWH